MAGISRDLVEEGLRLLPEAKPTEPPGASQPERKPNRPKPRPGSLHELLYDLCGAFDDLPSDLSTNKKYFEGYGE